MGKRVAGAVQGSLDVSKYMYRNTAPCDAKAAKNEYRKLTIGFAHHQSPFDMMRVH
jgi:hypothetical protein